MRFGAQAFFSVQKKSQKGGFKEEREHAFHHQRLADYATCHSSKVRPVGAELEFHRDSGDDAKNEINAEYFCPEARRLIVDFIVRAERQGFQHHDQ